MVTALSGVVLVAMFVQLVKSFLEAFGLQPTARLHDPVIWLLAFVSGIAGYVIDAAIHTTLTAPIAEDAAGKGLLAAFSAVGLYSLATHPFFDAPPTTALALAPVHTTGFLHPAPASATITIGQTPPQGPAAT